MTQHAMGYVVSSYDGGSETGTERATLHVLCADTTIRSCGSVDLGHFVWALPPERRRDFPGAATSLNKRPHVEVRLKPTFEPIAGIRLSIAIDTGASAEWGDETRDELARIRANAGLWRMTAGKLVRAR